MMERKTHRRSVSLESRIFAAFERSIADGRPDVAGHLLRALETLACTRKQEGVLDRAYLRITRPKAS